MICFLRRGQGKGIRPACNRLHNWPTSRSRKGLSRKVLSRSTGFTNSQQHSSLIRFWSCWTVIYRPFVSHCERVQLLHSSNLVEIACRVAIAQGLSHLQGKLFKIFVVLGIGINCLSNHLRPFYSVFLSPLGIFVLAASDNLLLSAAEVSPAGQDNSPEKKNATIARWWALHIDLSLRNITYVHTWFEIAAVHCLFMEALPFFKSSPSFFVVLLRIPI